MRAYERLLNYVKIHTTSIDDAETVPSASEPVVFYHIFFCLKSNRRIFRSRRHPDADRPVFPRSASGPEPVPSARGFASPRPEPPRKPASARA